MRREPDGSCPGCRPACRKLCNECTEALNFMAFPHEHWRQINSTNLLERLNRELKRRANWWAVVPSLLKRISPESEAGVAVP